VPSQSYLIATRNAENTCYILQFVIPLTFDRIISHHHGRRKNKFNILG